MMYSIRMAISRITLNRFSWVNDPDEALDMAYDYEHGDYDDRDEYIPDEGLDV